MAEPSFSNAPSIEAHIHEVNHDVEVSWMDSIMDYILHGTQPADKAEERKLRAVAFRYTIVDGKLFKRSYTGPLLRCLANTDAVQVVTEIHEGHCGNHSGGRTLAHKAMSQGYYWLTMRKDAVAYSRPCNKCQRFAPTPHLPLEDLTSISSPWSFIQ